jgi:hypothetical protein
MPTTTLTHTTPARTTPARTTPARLGELVTATRYEPCDRFTPDGSGEPVCCDCGWLDDEHQPVPPSTPRR